MKLPRIIVYTAITEGYDSLKSGPTIWEDEAEFVAFMEKPVISRNWKVLPLKPKFSDPCRNARMYKTMPHRFLPETDYSLWVDGCVSIISTRPLTRWIKRFLGQCDMALFKHYCRSCIYEEAAVCLKKDWDDHETIFCQMRRYYAAGYPVGNGLAETTVVLRRHTKAIQRFNEVWHKEICLGSRRDQLSFDYVARELGLTYACFEGTIHDNSHFQWHKHLAPRSAPDKKSANGNPAPALGSMKCGMRRTKARS